MIEQKWSIGFVPTLKVEETIKQLEDVQKIPIDELLRLLNTNDITVVDMTKTLKGIQCTLQPLVQKRLKKKIGQFSIQNHIPPEQYQTLQQSKRIVVVDEEMGELLSQSIQNELHIPCCFITKEEIVKNEEMERYIANLQHQLSRGLTLSIKPTMEKQDLSPVGCEPYSQINDYIYIGSDQLPSSKDAVEQLSALGVTHVLNMAAELQLQHLSSHFEYKWIPCVDNTEMNLDDALQDAISFLGIHN